MVIISSSLIQAIADIILQFVLFEVIEVEFI